MSDRNFGDCYLCLESTGADFIQQMMITMGDNELRSIVHQLTHSPSLPSSQSLPVAAAKFSLLTFFPLFVQYKYLLLSMYGRFIAWILVALDLYPEISDANFKCML